MLEKASLSLVAKYVEVNASLQLQNVLRLTTQKIGNFWGKNHTFSSFLSAYILLTELLCLVSEFLKLMRVGTLLQVNKYTTQDQEPEYLAIIGDSNRYQKA